MNTELRIKKFKRVYDEIALRNFDFVNYFVGENGSGKTSVLNGISFLNDGSNSRHFFGPESILEFKCDEHLQYLFWNNENPNKTEHRGDLNPNIYLLISNAAEKGANGLKGNIKFNSMIGIGNADSLSKFNAFLEEIGHNTLTAKKFVDQSDPFNQDNGRLIFETNQSIIEPSMIADGLKVLYHLKTNLANWISEMSQSGNINFVIIEEPENNLHPNLQKEIPVLLNNIYSQLPSEMTERIFFFISTHSPFVISASSEFENQKVFPLQNGKPLVIDFDNHSWAETNISEGYKGSHCAYIVSKMLGADITDMGYPENYCILEEYSLQLILDDARNKGIIKNIQFVSASGVSKSLDLSETIYEIEKLNTLIKCNPYYFNKYYLVIDNADNIEDNELKKRLNKIGERLNERFVELTLHSLEDYYSNLDEQLEKTAKEEIAKKATPSEQGKCKASFAKQIKDKIVDRDTFSKLFNGELDFLLSS